MNEKWQVDEFDTHNWDKIKNYEKGFNLTILIILQFDKKNKRLNAMILTTGDDGDDDNHDDCKKDVQSDNNSIMVSNSNKWMFLNVKNDVGVFYKINNYSHSDPKCKIDRVPSRARSKSHKYIDKGKRSFSDNWYDILTDALVVKCCNWYMKIGECKTYDGFRIFESNNLNDII